MDVEDGGMPPGYNQEGFLAIQHAVANAYLHQKSASTLTMPTIYLQVYV